MVLVCDIILKDHVTKGLSSFMGRVFQIELRGRGKRRNIARWIVFIGWGESSEKKFRPFKFFSKLKSTFCKQTLNIN